MARRGDVNPGPSLVVHDLSHAFARREVVAGVGFEVEAGRAVALVGPSGCGKSTVLNLCAGLLRVREGSIENGYANPACMFQEPRLLPWKSALDNVALGLKAIGMARDERHARAHALARRFGLSAEDVDKFPHELSGGMRSRIALARALAIEPDLLLLDEPFSALDVGLKEELYGLLVAYRVERDAGVLMITHDLAEAVRLSDRILVMTPSPGRIAARFDLALPASQRDDAWVYRHAAGILQSRTVRECFGLPPVAAAPDGDASANGGFAPSEVSVRERTSAERVALPAHARCGA
ncbi:MAG: ATP-binding cassette domain-containing protein [Betaproteobacteria bacterium PRO3]|nr:ATP-binding cassette domain-containing protein [Betaproteobacteria bacterium PRO3]